MICLRSKQALGLDLGQAAAKAVLLSHNGREIRFEGGRILNCRGEGILDEAELGGELRPWLEPGAWHRREVTVGVPQYVATAQVGDFPTNNPRDLDRMVELESQQLAGLSEENFLSDHQSMPPAFGRRQPVLIGICRESVIEERARNLMAADLRIADFAIGGTALASAYFALHPEAKATEALHLLLEIGAENSTVAIVGKGNLLYASSLTCGTDRYVQALARQLAVSPEEAERDKNQTPVNPADRDAPATLAAAVFESELNSIVNQWRSEEPTEIANRPLARICLCGGGARINGLAEFFGDRFSCAAETIGVPAAAGQPDPSLIIAYGLALQGLGMADFEISLAPAFVKQQNHRRRRFPFLAASLGILAVLLVLAGLRDFRRLETRKAALQSLLRQVETSHSMVPEMEDMQFRTETIERMLLPYVEKGNRLYLLHQTLETLGAARARVTDLPDNDPFIDAWTIYLADEQTFHAGKQGSEPEGRRRAEARPLISANPFRPDRGETGRTEARGAEPSRTIAVTDIRPWRSFVAALYTASPPNSRYEQVRTFIDQLNLSRLFRNVDLMLSADTVGREDIFMPWLRLTSEGGLDYRRFIIHMPLRNHYLQLPDKPPAEGGGN